uniref:LRRCT domain-containing protein n=1 Tax=Hucho hucho TaxID=62062 RepID=A0A4W5PHH2_9TELE
MWSVLLFLLVQPLLTDSMVCPSSCMCNLEGAVKCSLAMLPFMLRLGISHSPLDTIHPEAFHVAPQLLSIKLSSNTLSSLPSRVFSPLVSLEQLHLDDNRLESIAPVLFEGLANLNELDISNNAIAHLDPNVFHSLSSLRYLNLGRNSLQQLPPTLFHSLTRLQAVTLSGNPWDCRCSIRDIASWMKLNEGVVSDRTDVICRNPYPLLLRPLGSLLDEEFKCDVTTPSSSRTIHVVSATALEEIEAVEFTPTTTAPEARIILFLPFPLAAMSDPNRPAYFTHTHTHTYRETEM